MKLGLICRYDNSGLGTLSREFARHLKPHKVLLVENGKFTTFPERYDDFDTRKVTNSISGLDRDWLLDDIDVLFTCETFYSWDIIKDCRRRNVKTALYTMFEMTVDPIPIHPDLYVCPSVLDQRYFPDNSVLLEPPIATDRLIWKERKVAHTFVHSGSHAGMNDRKGTQVFLDAIPLVKDPDVRFIIYTWNNHFKVPDDSRIEVRVVNFKNYWQMWREGDVLVYPQTANGICLPIIEAMSSGMAVITTDIYPFNEYMPKELLFPPCETYRHSMGIGLVEVEDYRLDPQDIADVINKIAGKDITRFSAYGKTYAEEHSWKVLLPEYERAFNDLKMSAL